MEMKPIAVIHSDFPTKFGIPRQSGLVEALKATVVFEPRYRNPDALRGLEGFSHLWILWAFSASERENWSATVRPPRLGGNTRLGVFATRSPFRPNPIGLSCVRLEAIEWEGPRGPVLQIAGADMMDQTPVLDIKPYLPHVDSRPEAAGGFAAQFEKYALEVEFPEPLLSLVPPENRQALIGVLRNDPRPAYQRDASRVYGFVFAGLEVRFTVEADRLTVRDVIPVR